MTRWRFHTNIQNRKLLSTTEEVWPQTFFHESSNNGISQGPLLRKGSLWKSKKGTNFLYSSGVFSQGSFPTPNQRLFRRQQCRNPNPVACTASWNSTRTGTPYASVLSYVSSLLIKLLRTSILSLMKPQTSCPNVFCEKLHRAFRRSQSYHPPPT